MNLTPEQVAAVYDFENVLESALKTVFTALQITAITTQDFGATKDDGQGNQVPVIDFQKARPRSEIMFTVGAGQAVWREITVDGVACPVDTSFKGQYRIDIVTAADIKIHAAYRTQIRFLMHTMGVRINAALPLHEVHQFFRDAGTSPTVKPEEGYLRTVLLFDIDFSIQDDAWDTIST